jgi:hypothetical protein
MSLVLLLYLAFGSSPLGLRLRGRHALFPPRGKQEKGEKRELLRHSQGRLAPAATGWESVSGLPVVRFSQWKPSRASCSIRLSLLIGEVRAHRIDHEIDRLLDTRHRLALTGDERGERLVDAA